MERLNQDEWEALVLRARKVRGSLVEMSHRSVAPHLGSGLSCVDILIAAYGKLLEIDPEYQIAWYCGSLSSVVCGEIETAERWLEEWEAKEPGIVQELRAWVASIVEGDAEKALRLQPAAATPFSDGLRGAYAIATGDWDLASRRRKWPRCLALNRIGHWI